MSVGQIRSPNSILFRSIDSLRLNRAGFTFLEIISVMAILAILASFSIPKLIQIDESAEREVIKTAIKELNTREMLEWQKTKLSDQGWEGDTLLFENIDYDLKPDFAWKSKAQATGGVLLYRHHVITVTRSASTSISPGKWAINLS